MEKPFDVGDVIVFNPEYAAVVLPMKRVAALVDDVLFDPDAVMIVKSIRPYADSDSGWHVDATIQDNDAAGVMVAWDSSWFVRKT